MNKIEKGYKEVIAPIVAVILLMAKGLFDIELPENLQNELVEALVSLAVVGVAIKGIIEDHFEGRDVRDKRKLEKKKDNMKNGGDK